MLYQLYQAHNDVVRPLRAAAAFASSNIGEHMPGLGNNIALRNLWAGLELLGNTKLTHARLPFGIRSVVSGNREVAVTEEAAHVTPFGTLLRFKKDVTVEQPRVLLVAPMSGHFATLLRGTVRTMLPDHDVYITDWHNARDVRLRDGKFDFDDFIDHIIRFLEVIGPGAHVVAVCQPCVAVLAAVALMAEDAHPAQPRSLTLMAGPIDCRVNPTKVNELATNHSIEWFEHNLIGYVPMRFAGAMRRVYPGFMQLTAFMSMNIGRHVRAHLDLFGHLVKGEEAKADATRTFYEEYFAVTDLPAEFYLQTVQTVFQEHNLPRGKLFSRGRKVNPRAIRRTFLFTVEGEKDDICSVGQTLAAQDLCNGLRLYMKRHHVQIGVGHYGVFNGKRWDNQIYPILKHVIHSSE